MTFTNNLYLRNTVTYNPDGSYVSTGYVFTVSTNGVQNWTNNLNLNNLSASTLTLTSTLTLNNLIINSTINTSTITTGLLNYSSLVGSTITSNTFTSNSTITVSTMTASGNVGIGTASPAQSLDVNGNIQVADSSSLFVGVRTDTNNSVRVHHTSNNGYLDYGSGFLQIRNNNGGSVTNTMVLSADNNIGIRTTNPFTQLDVRGGILTTSTGGNKYFTSPYGSTFLTYVANDANNLVTNAYLVGGNTNSFVTYQSWYTGASNVDPASTERMRLTPTGLGIGTTNPVQNLDVNGVIGTLDSTGARWGIYGFNGNLYINLRDSSTGGYIRDFLTIYSTGVTYFSSNVGIGTTTPQTKLQINNTNGLSTLGGPNQYAGLHLAPSGTNSTLAGITFGGNNVDVNSTQAGLICQSDTSYGTKLYFQTTDSYITGAQNRMVISNTGQVGIGTTNPNGLLNINGVFNTESWLTIYNSTLDTWGSTTIFDNTRYIKCYGGAENTNYFQVGPGGVSIGNSYNPPIFTNGGQYGLLVQNSVGIGTTSPLSRLHVYAASGDNNIITDCTSGQNAAISFRKGGTQKASWYVPGGSNDLRTYNDTLGTDIMSITASGAVGIGTTNPNNLMNLYSDKFGPLSLIRTGAGDNFGVGTRFELVSATGTFRQEYARVVGGADSIATTASTQANGYFYVDLVSSGAFIADSNRNNAPFQINKTNSAFLTNVGIGTTSPLSALDVYANAGSTGILNVRNPQSNALASTVNSYTILQRWLNYTSTSVGGNAVYLNILNTRTSQGTDWYTTGLRLQAQVDTTYQAYLQFNGGNDYGISFGYSGSPSPNNAAEAMRIANGGNVGIGTTNPLGKLHVYTSGANNNIITDCTSANNASIMFSKDGTQKASWYIPGNSNDLRTWNASYGDIMSITASGRVGIGTTNPVQALDVNGIIALTDEPTSGTTTKWAMYGSEGKFYIGLRNSSGNYVNNNIILYSTGITQLTSSVGIGTVPIERLTLNSSGANDYFGIRFIEEDNSTLGAFIKYDNGNDYLVIGTTQETDRNAIYIPRFSGNVGIGKSNPSATLDVNGSLAKTSGTFDIPHPLYPSTNRRLVHSFIEGPRCDLIYRGNKQLVNGTISINIDNESTQLPECGMDNGTFESLCRNPTFFLQNTSGFNRVIGNISSNYLTITCESSTSNDIISWMVVAERKDEKIKEWNRTDSNGYLITQYDTLLQSTSH